jgi:hypothetical protein
MSTEKDKAREATALTVGECEELEELRREMHLSSLGDRPHSISAARLKRLIDLETCDRIRRARQIAPETSGVMVDNAGNWFGHRDYHPTTTLIGPDGNTEPRKA